MTELTGYAFDLLEAAYNRSSVEEREGQRLRLTILDGDVAENAGLVASDMSDSPESRIWRESVKSLLNSGAVVIPDIVDQSLGGATFYAITSEGEQVLRFAGRIS